MFSRFKPHGSFKNDVLQPLVMGAFLSDKYLKLNRLAALLMSKLHGKASQIDIFVAADDAHSYLLLQCAQILLRRYALHAVVWVLPPGTNGWASSFDVKYKWGVRDAGLLAALYGLKEPLLADMCPQSIALVTQRMQAESKESGNSVARTLKAMSLLWDSGGGGLTDCIANTITVDESLEQNAAHLSRLGYYNPGAIHFQGEFYPPNRLHHLERRLLQDFHVLSKDRGSSGALLFNHEEDCERDIDYKQAVVHSTACPQDHTHANPPVELYYSFRSPYSQLILPRLRRVCSHYGHSLILRPVLPMVTRGLKVPLEKEIYIAKDAAREAKIWGIHFGNLIDPLHPDKLPFLRAFDAFGVAQKYGRECDFVENYGACQWGMGISAGTDEGLKTMLTMSGLGHKWEEVQSVINSESPEEKFSKWEIYASENRDYITNHGLWGVPCIRYGDVLLFGQDKLWAIKHVLECKSSGSSRLHARPTQGWEYNERILAAIKQYGGMQ